MAISSIFSSPLVTGSGAGRRRRHATTRSRPTLGHSTLGRVRLGKWRIGDLLKLLLARVRPYAFTLDGSVWTTFGQWLPALSTGSEGQSFPSGHTATAVAMAGALIWLYPNGRYLFPLLAVLVGCQRIESGPTTSAMCSSARP